MNQGYLSQYFEIVTAKRLSAVEVDLERSHQHEFNGTKELKKVLGQGSGEKLQFSSKFIWFGEENEALSSESTVTWYDARLEHPIRSEFRLYFYNNEVMEMAKRGDMLFIAKRTDGTLLIVITTANSTIENQLLWLFGIPSTTGTTFTSQNVNDDDKEVDFAVRFILEELGIEIEEPEADYLDSLLAGFGKSFPNTNNFSAFARKTLKDVNAYEAPDLALIAWMEHEEKLFRRLERQIVEERLHTGFINNGDADIDGFINFSLSVQNRRKSRAGHAFENHFEEILHTHSIRYSKGVKTENNSKPDFVFPSGEAYHDNKFPANLLTILGVKTSCKDRWRQVLAEAQRIEVKHLLTLEPGISENQTNEMKMNQLQLVLPSPIHETYSEEQRKSLLSISDFIELLNQRQIQIFNF